MYLIVILIAIALLQLWGARNPLHNDGWFIGLRAALARNPVLTNLPAILLVLSLGLPVALILVAEILLPGWLWFVLALSVLLYSLGRGEFAVDAHAYTLACRDKAWETAIGKARQQGVDTDTLEQDQWFELNQRMVQAVAYQGFERLFAVLFWFLLFGPAGALLYRLAFIYAKQSALEESDGGVAAHCLWALEWPAVRLLGLSFAVTGNFVGCVNRWKRLFYSVESSSAEVLRESVLGALSADDDLVQSVDCTEREVSALKRLYTRTFWFWVCCLAIGTIMLGV
jgi:AmpE protein